MTVEASMNFSPISVFFQMCMVYHIYTYDFLLLQLCLGLCRPFSLVLCLPLSMYHSGSLCWVRWVNISLKLIWWQQSFSWAQKTGNIWEKKPSTMIRGRKINCLLPLYSWTFGRSVALFVWGDWGSPSGGNFVNPLIWHLSLFLDQGLPPPPPPAKVRPQKCENLNKYIFVSNLTTFKLKSTFKSCISCLK